MTDFTGTGTLIRFILRRDRIRIPIWIVGILFFVTGTAASLPQSLPTQEDLQARAQLIDTPAFRMMFGPGYGRENYTYGAMMSNEMLGITGIAIALMSIFMVVRHTRAEEESGRAELVRSSIVGRHAQLTAILVTATALNLVIGAIVALSMYSALEDLDLTGSLLFGASLAALGITFAAIAAVSVQINEFSRAASGMAAAAVGVFYAIRGFGDIQENVLSWLSPFGWSLHTAPYVLDRWWPLGLSLAFSVIVIPIAYALSTRRDVAAGIAPPRPGPATASDRLTRPLGMALRMQRGSLIGWTIGITLFAVGIGSIVSNAADLFADNPTAQQYLESLGLDESALVDSALSLYITFFAMAASIYTVSTITRLRGEETSLRAENLLATAVSRVRWVGESLAFGILTSTVILLFAGLGAGALYAADTGESTDIWPVVGASLAYAPTLWLAAAIAVAVFGLVPRAMALAWAVPAYGFIVLSIGPVLGLPDWLLEISPFEQIPRMPAVDFDAIPLLIITAIATALIAAGLYGIQRRDLDFT